MRETPVALCWLRRGWPRGSVLHACLLVALAAACSESGPSEPAPPPAVSSIEVAPGDPTLTWIGATRQFAATARDAAGNELDEVVVTWSTSEAGVAVVDAATGLATAVGTGLTTISAAAGSVSGGTTLNVTQLVATVDVTPPEADFTTLGRMLPFTAVARDSGAVVVPGRTFTWTSSDTTIARVDAQGVVTAVGEGAATISATTAGGSDSATVDVVQAVATIEVSPSEHGFATLGRTVTLAAVARDSGSAVVPDRVFVWTSSDTTIARVDADGVVTAVGEGVATIGASSGAASDSATITIAQVVATVDVSPAQHAFATLGRAVPFAAVALDSAEAAVPGRTFVWTSSDTTVARVDGAGVVTAVGEGAATIIASTAGGSDSASVDVVQVVASLLVTPALDTILAAGQTRAFTALARDSGGSTVTSTAATWSSSDEAVATVDVATGVATATGPGAVDITAHAGPVSEVAALHVRDGTLIGDYVLLTDYGSTESNAYIVGDIFAVWWDPSVGDFSADAQIILDRLIGIREEALDVGWLDPPNPAFGTYVNIYLHVPGSGNDNWPDFFGNGVGTDSNGVPFMSLPAYSPGAGFHLDHSNIRHEACHVFQYTNSSTGYDYFGDARWFTEASANWFAAIGLPGENGPFIAAATIPANPQLALWHGFDNAAPGDPSNWNRDTRQYAMNTWLHWVTTAGGQSVGVIVDGFNAGTTMLPQEYMLSRVPSLRALFADWAAHNTADMDYLSPAQWAAAQNEIVVYGDPADIHPFVAELTSDGTAGAWLEPPTDLRPRGWSYNVVRVAAPVAATYDFELDGAPTGSEGAAARFEVRVLVRTPTGDAFHEMSMQSAQDGTLSVDVPATATDVYLVIVSVPDHFTGNQTYSYRASIAHD